MFTLPKTLKPPTVLTVTRRLLTTVKLPEPASSAAYDDLIYTAGINRDFTTVRHLLNHRYTNGFFTTNNTFKFISTNLYVLNDVIKTVSDLNESHARKKAYESLISRLCKLQLIDSALHVAETAAGKHAADASTFHPILSFVTRKKNFDLAWRVVEVMKANNVARDVTCYNFLLTSYSVAGDLKSTAGVLRIMETKGVRADARTYDALVLGACKAGKVDGAIGIMVRMVEEGVGALYATYAHVIGSLVKLGYCAQAVEFVVGYSGKDKKLDSHNFGLLASRLMGVKKMDEVKYVLEEMVKRELDMDESLQNYYNENVS
ncbi:pentatricopeptide repeat-containing protein At2g40240, mitochondrial-like [Bidens hawaiensis]|uniref:pentatricopeptide repeat-containing protein At2g40240, mitochondrial-like n=1 Tax=Bidens hawaiensis TaxID=980011 RepID=UPI00404AA1D0